MVGVEVWCAGDGDVREEVGVSRGGDGRGEGDEVVDVVVEVVGRVVAVEERGLYIAVRGDGGDAEEEGPGGVGGGLVEEAEGFLG
jgi:hypothetical protein